MSFLKTLLTKKENSIKSYDDFWTWFQANQRSFHNVVKKGQNFERDFFNKLSPKLAELNDGYYFLTGMLNDNTAELVFTADGRIKNFVFVEELVDSAPDIIGWKFTAHKPALEIENVNIEMAGLQFNQNNLSFYSNDNPKYPDEIDISIVHHDLNDENKDAIGNGIFIFLDNFLGELNFAVTIDSLNVAAQQNIQKELIPIKKLKDYLTWRQKEFIEKYDGVRHDIEKDNYSGFEAKLENGNALIAVINTALVNWDRKASHPWILSIEIKYAASRNGMPDETTYSLLDIIENEIGDELRDVDGYLNIGRQTADGVREIYFACKEFRKPSKVTQLVAQKYKEQLDINYDIYKDKYWRSFDRFMDV
jgi:hypothetical protein